MSLDAAAGAEVEAGPLDIGAQIAFHLGSLADSERRRADRADRRAQAIPADVPLRGQGVASTAGVAYIDLGGVPQGKVWQVRRIVVGAPVVTSAAPGSAYAFATGNRPDSLSIVDCVDIFLTLPMGNTYGTHQLYLVGGEHLWVAISGGTSGAQYVASGRAEEWEPSDFFGSSFAE